VSRDEREHGSRTSKTRRDVRTSESRDSTPPLLPSSCEACRVYQKKPITGKKFVSPSPPFYVLRCAGSAGSVLPCFIVTTDLSGPKHSPASVASYTPVLAAWRRFAEARPVPFSLLAALRSSLIILLQVPLKNSPDFWYKTGDFGPK
jgi:hypothetical protein